MIVASKNLEYCLDLDKYNDPSDLLKSLQEKKKKKEDNYLQLYD